MEEQYVDGTKIESKANKYTFVWKKTVQKNREKLIEKTKVALVQVKGKIKLLTGRDESEDSEDSLKILGNRNSYSKTDKDATFMRLKEDAMNNGQTKPAYNLQIATENQYFTNFDFYSNPTDTLTFKPFLKKFKWRHGKQSKTVTADSGYGSLENYEFIEEENMVGYVKYNMFHKEQHKPYKQDAFNQANLYYNKEENYLVCPMGQHMEEWGQFGQTKFDMGYKRFRHFGIDKIYMDFGIFAISANLKKLLQIKRYEM